jgi:hypothetical protein
MFLADILLLDQCDLSLLSGSIAPAPVQHVNRFYKFPTDFVVSVIQQFEGSLVVLQNCEFRKCSMKKFFIIMLNVVLHCYRFHIEHK